MAEKKYDYARIKKELQDEYMAAMLVGFTENTPDIMDIEFSNREELIKMARVYGIDPDEFVIEDSNK